MLEIKKLRLKAGLSQRQLADKANVKLATIQAWEQRGSNQDSLRRIARICDVLNCKVKDLID